MTATAGTPTAVGTTIGVLGGDWRATVSPSGTVTPADGTAPLQWSVVAEDRWHRPDEAGAVVRQHHLLGAPVVETALRIVGGDAVQRVYAVADHGGLTVVEIENRSSRSVAVVFSRNDLLTSRPVSSDSLAGTDAPAGSIAVPLAHGTTVRVALAHDGRIGGPLPGPLSSADQVARGWRAQVDRGPRLVLADEVLAAQVVADRSAILLDTPGAPADDPVRFLLAAQVWARLGQTGDELLDDVVVATERVAKIHRRTRTVPWDAEAALAAAADVAGRCDDEVAAGDVAALRRRLGPAEAPPAADRLDDLDGPRRLGALVAGFATGRDTAVDLLAGLPRAWFGQGVEAYGVPVGGATVSVAVRWHGARPALLWESSGVTTVTARRLDPAWGSTDGTGEALLAVPADVGDTA
jgi:hypothetical protein